MAARHWQCGMRGMQICKLCHDDIGHLGVEKTLAAIGKWKIVIEQFNDVTGS